MGMSLDIENTYTVIIKRALAEKVVKFYNQWKSAENYICMCGLEQMKKQSHTTTQGAIYLSSCSNYLFPGKTNDPYYEALTIPGGRCYTWSVLKLTKKYLFREREYFQIGIILMLIKGTLMQNPGFIKKSPLQSFQTLRLNKNQFLSGLFHRDNQ